MNVARIPKQPDIVFVFWEKNPLRPESLRRIQKVSIVGTAFPCRRFLIPGKPLFHAKKCLLEHGFVIVCQRRTIGVSGFIVFKRS